ncbi:MAG: CopD family protein [Burkholderiaceae bacterium]
MKLYSLLLLVHVLGVIVWVGGMWVMHVAVRPAAVALLAPAQRLPLLADVLARFFFWVAIAIGLILASGVAMILGAGGVTGLHPSVHAMTALGLVMMAIFAHLRLALFKPLQLAVGAQDLPLAAAKLDQIRQRVALNLVLGLITTAVAIVGRAF